VNHQGSFRIFEPQTDCMHIDNSSGEGSAGNKGPGSAGERDRPAGNSGGQPTTGSAGDKSQPAGSVNRPIRVLVAKVGLDGHDRGARVIATALRDSGMEVIYTGLRQTPEMVVGAALQEDVDAIGISILSGAHMTVFPRIIQLMKERNMDDVLLTGGGIIPDEDRRQLQELGVGELFPPGTSTADIANYIRQWVAANRDF
jgi:methylmalonyl-CoA mutase C-terminal domain/subunit